MTSHDILNALMHWYACRSMKGWLLFPELKLGTGYTRRSSQRAIDLFALNTFPSNNYLRIAYEIKASQSDFYREKADVSKTRAALQFCNQFYFVTPEGLLKPAAIPIECGLIEIIPAGDGVRATPMLKTIVEAPYYDTVPNWGFIASLSRRINANNRAYWNTEAADE